MGFAFSIKKVEPFMNEETMNKAIVKFQQLKFEKHFLTKSFISLLPTDNFITTSKTYACEQETTDEHFRQLQFFSIDKFSSKTKTGKNLWYFNNSFLYKPFFSQLQNMLSSLKSQKNNYCSTDYWEEYIKSCFKKC